MRVRKINIVLKMTIHVTKMFRIGADNCISTARKGSKRWNFEFRGAESLLRES